MHTGTKDHEQEWLQGHYLYKTGNDLNIHHSRMDEQHISIMALRDNENEGTVTTCKNTDDSHKVE